MSSGLEAQLDGKVERIADKYDRERQNVLAMLHELQEETVGNYVKERDLEKLAQLLDLAQSDLQSVISFYSMFSTRPRGKYIIRVCESGPCSLMGSDSVFDALKEKLGVDIYGTTEDGLFTLEPSSCLGVCAVAPAMMINDETYGNLTRNKIGEIIEYYREKEETENAADEKGE